MLYGSDSDISASDDDERAASAPKKTQNRKSQQKKNKSKEDGAYIHEGDDEVLDLLDDKMMSRISGEFFFPSFFDSFLDGMLSS